MFNWDEHTLLFELFDVNKFLSRAKGVQGLIVRGGTEGEKEAAKQAMERMVARAKEESKELSPEAQRNFWRQFDAIRATTTANAEKATARRSSDDFYRGAQQNTRSKPDQAEKDAEYARNREKAERKQQDSSGSSSDLGIKIHCYAMFQEGTSDKVYGIVSRDGKVFTFWGRNGASLSTKEQSSYNAALSIFNSKIKKGYREVSLNRYHEKDIMMNLRF